MNQRQIGSGQTGLARVNVDSLGVSELKWTRMGEFNSDNHDIYYCGQESLRINGSVQSQQESKMQYLDAISKTAEWSLFVSKANRSLSQ